MALPETERLILVAVLAGLMLFVVFFEWRVMRGKSREIKVVSQKKDEAFNAILTTRTVMNAVRNRGGNTGGCEELLNRAKEAMNRGNYDSCIDLCEKARSELTAPSSRVVGSAEAQEAEAMELEEVAETILSSREEALIRPDSYKGSKLSSPKEGNYLGAKFEISAAKADLGKAARSGSETSLAESLMVEAESAYMAGNYDRALSLAVRARKAISSEAASETIPLKAGETKPAPAAKVFDIEEEEARPPEANSCPNCGAIVEPDDTFCPRCGAKVEKERICQSCGTKPKLSDVFCRKCGSKID